MKTFIATLFFASSVSAQTTFNKCATNPNTSSGGLNVDGSCFYENPRVLWNGKFLRVGEAIDPEFKFSDAHSQEGFCALQGKTSLLPVSWGIDEHVVTMDLINTEELVTLDSQGRPISAIQIGTRVNALMSIVCNQTNIARPKTFSFGTNPHIRESLELSR